mgnify:CR=1 FL=1
MKTRVSWDYFMRRRNIQYSSLVGMEYDRYTAWCHSRCVIPLDKEEYEAKITPFKPKIESASPTKVVEKVEKKNTIYDHKSLNRKKKAELVDLCRTNGIDIKGNETKKQLVSLILGMNNA